MKRVAFLLGFAAVSASPALAQQSQQQPQQPQPPNPNIPDNAYLEAERTADQFAFAWSQRDAKLGASTLAPDLKAKMTPDEISTFFVGTSTPVNFAFLLGHQRLVSPGLFRFDLHLYRYQPNAQGLVQDDKALTLDVGQVDDVWFVKAMPY